MDQNDGKLVRINDPSEIKVGRACKLVSCINCGKTTYLNITEISIFTGNCVDITSGTIFIYSGPRFKTMPPNCHGYEWEIFKRAINEGRLFAIVDENLNFEETTVVKKKPIKIVDKLERIK